jgi:hypothetical protein
LQVSPFAPENDLDHKVTAMLYGYFALSGDQQESGICCLCGFIAEADDWNSVDHAWRSLFANFSCDFDATACLHGTGICESWDTPRRHTLLADLAEVLARPVLLPMGAFVVRDHFSGLSPADRAILGAEGITSPLDVIFHDLTERVIRRAHQESEKISLLLDQEPQSAAERYNALFNKHLSRYLLGPHLMGALAFSNARTCSYLQVAKLLGETVLLLEMQSLFREKACTSFTVPLALQRIAGQIREQGRFDTAGLEKMVGRLKNISLKSIKPK